MTSPRISNEQLLAFAAGELTGDEKRRVAAHVAAHPAAARTVELYRLAQVTTVADDTVAPPAEVVARVRRIYESRPVESKPSWLEKIDAVIASLIYDSRVQPAAVRYADASARFQLSFETEAADLDLQAERLEGSALPEAGARWRLVGQVSAEETLGVVEVALLTAGGLEPVALTRSDDRSVFTFDVAAGTYDLRLRLPDAVIVLEQIELQ
jgi:hypothetical protein